MAVRAPRLCISTGWRPTHVLRFCSECSSPFGLFLLGWFAFSLAVSSFASFYPVLMSKGFDVPVRDAAMVMSIATVLSIPLYNLAGTIVARAGAAWVLAIGYAGRLLPMTGMAVLAKVSPSHGFWGAIVLAGIFQGVWPLLSVAANDLAASLAPFGEGPAIGLFNAAAAIATAFGAVAAGGIVGHFGYSAVPAFAAAVILAALLTVRGKARSRDYAQAAVVRLRPGAGGAGKADDGA
jgi:MFS family permease